MNLYYNKNTKKKSFELTIIYMIQKNYTGLLIQKKEVIIGPIDSIFYIEYMDSISHITMN